VPISFDPQKNDTPRAGLVHVISLRKANRREIKLYEAQTN